jgi:hypothetical protein
VIFSVDELVVVRRIDAEGKPHELLIYINTFPRAWTLGKVKLLRKY